MKKQKKDITEYERKCPECGKVLYYKTKGNLNWANKLNRKCKTCSFTGKVGKYERTPEIRDQIKQTNVERGHYENLGKILSIKFKLNPSNKPKYTKEEIKQRKKESRKITNQKPEYKEKEKNRHLKRLKEEPSYRLRTLYRHRIHRALKDNIKLKKSIELLGCEIDFYRQYLESKFLPEMNWDNWGDIWEIDHIIPIASFDLVELENQLKCFNYLNTQPLFKTTEIAESFGYIGYIGNKNKLNKML